MTQPSVSNSCLSPHETTTVLSWIEATAHHCDVRTTRYERDADWYAVVVTLDQVEWLLYPDPQKSGWVAAPPSDEGAPDLSQAFWLPFQPREARIPSASWGGFLAASDTFPAYHLGRRPPPPAPGIPPSDCPDEHEVAA